MICNPCLTLPSSSALSTADNLDRLTMAVAVVAAVANGALLPMFSLLFGEFTNAFGNPDPVSFMDTIKGLALKFLYLGIGEIDTERGLSAVQ